MILAVVIYCLLSYLELLTLHPDLIVCYVLFIGGVDVND